MSSVVPPITHVLQTMIEAFFQQSPILVSPQSPLGLTLRYPNPEEIGTDRLSQCLSRIRSVSSRLTHC